MDRDRRAVGIEAHRARRKAVADQRRAPPSSVPSTNVRLRWLIAAAASSSVEAMNSASSVSGKTVIAEPLKIVSPMRSPRRPAASLTNSPQDDGVELVHRGRDVEAEHHVSVADVALQLAVGDRSHRQPDSGQPDDRQGGDLAAEQQVVAPSQPAEHGRCIGAVDVGDAHLVVSRRSPAPRASDVHDDDQADDDGRQRADEADPRLDHHHCSTVTMARSTPVPRQPTSAGRTPVAP